jgi:hypothetical protein
MSSRDGGPVYGAAAGVLAIGLYLAGAIVGGTPPDFDASGSEIARWVADNRTQIQVGAAIQASWTPLFVCFLATVASLARAGGPTARRMAAIAFGCGLVFLALFLADVTALAVSALRPENLTADPELASALHDFEWMAMGAASFLVSGTLAAFAALALRENLIWPRWLGWLAALAAVAYALRAGTLFSTDGAFAADGLLGLWVPVIAAAGWIALASVVLTVELRRGAALPAPS